MNSVKKVTVGVHKNTAFCEELGVAATAATPEEAVRMLADKIRQNATEPVSIVLPYLGESFDVRWSDIKKVKKEWEEVDEFEMAQKIAEGMKQERRIDD